jgi:hypothetical protein
MQDHYALDSDELYPTLCILVNIPFWFFQAQFGHQKKTPEKHTLLPRTHFSPG